jgi:hypothetical protein
LAQVIAAFGGSHDMGGPNARLGIQESIPNLVATTEGQMGKPGLHYLDYLGCIVPR